MRLRAINLILVLYYLIVYYALSYNVLLTSKLELVMFTSKINQYCRVWDLNAEGIWDSNVPFEAHRGPIHSIR